MAASQALFEKLAEALGKPSKTYQAAVTGLGIPEQALEGYMAGSDSFDKIRQRKLGQKSLAEVLGGTPEGLEGFGNITLETGERIGKPISAIADLRKATRENDPTLNSEQFVGTQGDSGVLFNGKNRQAPFRLSPLPGVGPMAPRVAPTLPAAESAKVSDMDSLLKDVEIVRQNQQPGFVGPIDSRVTKAKQLSGYGATPEAAIFGSTISGLRNKVLNLLSGAAISPAEATRLMQQLPNENMSEVDFNARLGNFERELKLQMGSRKQGFSNAGYRGQGNEQPSFGGAQAKTFANEQEAEASGYKGPAIIGGKRAVIH